jgi:ATP-dependent Lon protease
MSYIKARARTYDLDPEIFDELDIHIHVPEGAIPKDGPSAGVTITTALISALTERKVRKDIGMTGEITLRGRVLPVGGVREKILAAHRAGLKMVILPKRNLKDLVDVPKRVRNDLQLVPVTHLDQVLEKALRTKEDKAKPKPRRTASASRKPVDRSQPPLQPPA